MFVFFIHMMKILSRKITQKNPLKASWLKNIKPYFLYMMMSSLSRSLAQRVLLQIDTSVVTSSTISLCLNRLRRPVELYALRLIPRA